MPINKNWHLLLPDIFLLYDNKFSTLLSRNG